MGRIDELRERADDRARALTERAAVARFLDAGRAYSESVQEHRLTGLAAEVAFYAVLSIFPAFIALAAALGSIDAIIGESAATRVQDGLITVLRDALGSDSASIVDAVERLFAEPSPGLLGFGLVMVVFTTSRGFNALIRALDVVYGVTETRGLIRTRLLALGLAAGSLLLGAIVLAMVVLGPLLGIGGDLADQAGFGELFATLWIWVRPPLLVLALAGWAATMFHLAPNHTTPWKADLPGAMVTMVLWLSGAVGFRLYLEVAGDDTNAVLGALGGALTLLLWLYVMGLALLLGAEVNAQLERRRRRRGQEGSTPGGEHGGDSPLELDDPEPDAVPIR